MTISDAHAESLLYRGLLECPFRTGFIEFEYAPGDRVSELLHAIEIRWGTSYGWATEDGFVDIYDTRELNTYGLAHGWLIAIEDQSGAYIALHNNDEIPLQTPGSTKSRQLPDQDGWYQDAPAHGCYNVERFGDPTTPFRIPIKRTYEIPSKSGFDVFLIALVAVSGG